METIELTREQLDELLRLHTTMILRQVDAGGCQTRFDWDRAHQAEVAFEVYREGLGL